MGGSSAFVNTFGRVPGGGGGGAERPSWVPADAVAAIILIGDPDNAWVDGGLVPIASVLSYTGVDENPGGWNSADGFGSIAITGPLLALINSMSGAGGLTLAMAMSLEGVDQANTTFTIQNAAETISGSTSPNADATNGFLYTNTGMNGMEDDFPASTVLELDSTEWFPVFGVAATFGATHLDLAVADSYGTLSAAGDTGTPRPTFDGPASITGIPMAAVATLYGIYIFPAVNDPFTLLPTYAGSLQVPA